MSFLFLICHIITLVTPLSLHDALPICRPQGGRRLVPQGASAIPRRRSLHDARRPAVCRPPSRRHSRRDEYLLRRLISRGRSEEHTSELQSPCNLVCRHLREKKNTKIIS